MPRDAGKLIEVARDTVLKGVRNARQEVFIAAPFVSLEVVEALATAGLASRARRLRFLTALTERSVVAGALDPRALRHLIEHDFEVRSIRNLHAKVTTIDASWGLVGSGNFTTRGLGGGRNGNVELGVVLQPAQVKQAHLIHQRWWRVAAPINTADLEIYEKLLRARRSGAGQRLAHGPELPVSAGESLSSARRRPRTGLWLKVLYHDSRRDRPKWWTTVDWVSDGRPPKDPSKPNGGPTYVEGDLLVFYLVERDGTIRCCPAIAEVTAEPVYDPAFVRRHGSVGDDLQWPWVTKVRVRHHTSLSHAPTLRDLGIRSESVRQQGHIVLEQQQFRKARSRITRSS